MSFSDSFTMTRSGLNDVMGTLVGTVDIPTCLPGRSQNFHLKEVSKNYKVHLRLNHGASYIFLVPAFYDSY